MSTFQKKNKIFFLKKKHPLESAPCGRMALCTRRVVIYITYAQIRMKPCCL